MNDETLRKAWAEMSARGGKTKSAAQTAARKKNAEKARKARAKNAKPGPKANGGRPAKGKR